MPGVVAALDVGFGGRPSLLPALERVEEDGEAPLGLRMTERRVQARERGVRYDVDGASAARRSDSWFRPSSRRKDDASAH